MKRKISAEARENIRAAQQRRWKVYRENAAERQRWKDGGKAIATVTVEPLHMVSEDYTRNLLRAALLIRGSDLAWKLVEEALQNLTTYKTTLKQA